MPDACAACAGEQNNRRAPSIQKSRVRRVRREQRAGECVKTCPTRANRPRIKAEVLPGAL